MGWPHYPFVEATYDRFNKFYKIQHGLAAATADHLSYPERSNYQKVDLFAVLQSEIHSLADGGTWGHFVVDRLYDGDTTTDNIDWTYCVDNAPLAQGDWTRKYYREVYDDTDTEEIFGSANGGTAEAVANGQRAYRRADKKIVDRVSGAWVINTTAREPDIITTGGYFSEGDLIGDWLFKEMNDVMDLFGAVVSSIVASGGGFAINVSPAEEPTAAAERSSCEAAYAAVAVSPPVSGADTPFAVSRQSTSDGTSFGSVLDKVSIFFGYGPSYFVGLSHGSVSDVAPCTADFYAIGTLGVAGTFDNQGEPVLNGLLKRFSTGNTAVGTTVESDFLGSDITDPPIHPWCADPTPGSPTSLGWGADNPIVILKYSVPRP